MKNNKISDNANAPQARDFWTARLNECPHERLREALKFQPHQAGERQTVNSTPQLKLRKLTSAKREAPLDWKNKSPFQVQLILWKREALALGRTAYAFLAGFLGFLLSQSQ